METYVPQTTYVSYPSARTEQPNFRCVLAQLWDSSATPGRDHSKYANCQQQRRRRSVSLRFYHMACREHTLDSSGSIFSERAYLRANSKRQLVVSYQLCTPLLCSLFVLSLSRLPRSFTLGRAPTPSHPSLLPLGEILTRLCQGVFNKAYLMLNHASKCSTASLSLRIELYVLRARKTITLTVRIPCVHQLLRLLTSA